uniref:Uncharacterized protein n=1 Tax=Meloidogyne javanica TaxID=6303 RepID=A0A915M409_MELJA
HKGLIENENEFQTVVLIEDDLFDKLREVDGRCIMKDFGGGWTLMEPEQLELEWWWIGD